MIKQVDNHCGRASLDFESDSSAMEPQGSVSIGRRTSNSQTEDADSDSADEQNVMNMCMKQDDHLI